MLKIPDWLAKLQQRHGLNVHYVMYCGRTLIILFLLHAVYMGTLVVFNKVEVSYAVKETLAYLLVELGVATFFALLAGLVALENHIREKRAKKDDGEGNN